MHNAYMKVGHDRMGKGSFDEAAWAFEHALGDATSPDEKASALQMLGVALRLLGELDVSMKTLNLAHATADSVVLKARITRDLGMTYLEQGDYTMANDAMRGSYTILTRNHELVEAAMSRGFQGRVVFLRGWRREGIELLREADKVLRGGDNRDYELNNLIWLMRMSFPDRLLSLQRAVRLVKQTGQLRRWKELAVIAIGGDWLYRRLRRFG